MIDLSETPTNKIMEAYYSAFENDDQLAADALAAELERRLSSFRRRWIA